eukprot:scaffold1205_cov249-Pinguiococcus_pyrenoidosus.AAC.2
MKFRQSVFRERTGSIGPARSTRNAFSQGRLARPRAAPKNGNPPDGQQSLRSATLPPFLTELPRAPWSSWHPQ